MLEYFEIPLIKPPASDDNASELRQLWRSLTFVDFVILIWKGKLQQCCHM